MSFGKGSFLQLHNQKLRVSILVLMDVVREGRLLFFGRGFLPPVSILVLMDVVREVKNFFLLVDRKYPFQSLF